MAAKYSDQSIAAMVAERKPLPKEYMSRLQLKAKRGHKERELSVTGANGNEYRLILRQNDFNALDFSIILALCPPKSNSLFRLRRYNGKSHEHTNSIERHKFYDFHIHKATARYQEFGTREDAFAEVTASYGDFRAALDCMIHDCGFDLPADPQGADLFEDLQK